MIPAMILNFFSSNLNSFSDKSLKLVSNLELTLEKLNALTAGPLLLFPGVII